MFNKLCGGIIIAVILGTVPGWERDSDWDSYNRTYRGPGYSKYIGQTISEEEAHYYRIVVNITVYLYESPCMGCNVALTRRIDDIEIIGLYRNEYSGGLDEWSRLFSEAEAEEILDRSRDEVGGLLDCVNCTRYNIDIVDSEYRPPIPVVFVQDIIDFYQPRIREAELIEQKEILRNEAVAEMVSRGLSRSEALSKIRLE